MKKASSNVKLWCIRLFACPNLQGVGTPLFFSRRGAGGEVLEAKSLPNKNLANRNQLKVKQIL
jgi:hypothetical protein